MLSTVSLENINYNGSPPSWVSELITRTLSLAYAKHSNCSVQDEALSRERSVRASLQNQNTYLRDKRFFFSWVKEIVMVWLRTEKFEPRSPSARELTSNERACMEWQIQISLCLK